MRGIGPYIVPGLLHLWTAYLLAIATGRWQLGRVRDARDSLQARWLFGGLSSAGGAVLYGSPFAISTMPLSITVEEILARIAAHRPTLIDRGDVPAPG